MTVVILKWTGSLLRLLSNIVPVVAHWVDPDFDPSLPTFYYVRVIEIPTPRWTAYDAKFFNVSMPEGTKMTVQDRAYTSPVWYTP